MLTEDKLFIYAGPDESYHVLGQLGLGDEINVIGNVNQWLKISKNNIIGWVINNNSLLIL